LDEKQEAEELTDPKIIEQKLEEAEYALA